jgi:hypothetical protein
MSKEISELPAALSVDDLDLVPVVDVSTGTTKKTTAGIIRNSLSAPIITGTVTYQGARCRILSIVGEVQTASTSPTLVASFTMGLQTSCAFDALVTYTRRTSVTKSAGYKRHVNYLRAAGAPAIVGAIVSGTDQETTPADDVTFTLNGNTIEVTVTAADADPRNWTCELRVQETDAT